MKENIFMVIFIIILGAILSSALVVVGYYTEEPIRKNEEIKLKKSVLKSFDVKFSDKNMEDTFDNTVRIKNINDIDYYISEDGRIAFEFEDSGLWGPINGVVALDADLITVLCPT